MLMEVEKNRLRQEARSWFQDLYFFSTISKKALYKKGKRGVSKIQKTSGNTEGFT